MNTQNEAAQIVQRHGLEITAAPWVGMEGVVFPLNGDLVAKVWHNRLLPEATGLCDFFSDVAALGLPFATPQMVDVFEDGSVVTVERHLPGRLLKEFVSDTDAASTERAMQSVLSVLIATRETRRPFDPRLLPIFGELPGANESGWDLLLRIARSRFESDRALFESVVPDASELLSAFESSVAPVAEPETLMHGDLCAENILVDENGNVTAVVNWGFLSGHAPHVVEVAIATGILDMYSSRASEVARQFSATAVAALGVDARDLLRSRALYSFLTATAYSTEGTDGHFAWCAAVLSRGDVREALAVR